jgi:hypothetical protein
MCHEGFIEERCEYGRSLESYPCRLAKGHGLPHEVYDRNLAKYVCVDNDGNPMASHVANPKPEWMAEARAAGWAPKGESK